MGTLLESFLKEKNLNENVAEKLDLFMKLVLKKTRL